MGDNLGNHAVRGVIWAIVQNWGGKLLTFLLFIVLARLLKPADFGLAAVSSLVLLLISQIAELGFFDAIIQRRDLRPLDVNLPFYISVFLSATLSLMVYIFAGRIEELSGSVGLRSILVVTCFISPLTTAARFQEALYRREFLFARLAFRVLIANVIAGVVAVLAAFLGLGVWSLVLQAYVTVVVSILWLWMRPVWKPGLAIDFQIFRALGRFGVSVVTTRILDFGSTRLVDFLILVQLGTSALGLYAVGSRLYSTLLQLLQSALQDVALTVLAKISHDRGRTAEIYIQTCAVSTVFAAPIFILIAAVSSEVCDLTFGSQWRGVNDIAEPLLILGGIQCIQFMNAAYLSALGYPSLVLRLNTLKVVSTIPALLLIPVHSAAQMVVVFAIAQTVATPLSFFYIARELRLRILRIIWIIAPVLGCMTAALFTVSAIRPHVTSWLVAPVERGGVLGIVFLAIYILLVLMLAKGQLSIAREFMLHRFRQFRDRRKPAELSMT